MWLRDALRGLLSVFLFLCICKYFEVVCHQTVWEALKTYSQNKQTKNHKHKKQSPPQKNHKTLAT